MKLNLIPTIIALAISGLIVFGFYSLWDNADLLSQRHIIVLTASFIFSTITLVSTVGIIFETGRMTTVVRTVSAIFFIIGLLTIILLSKFTSGTSVFIIVTGILFLLYLLLTYSLVKTRQ